MGSGMHKFLTDFVQTDGFIQSEYGKFIAVGLVADIATLPIKLFPPLWGEYKTDHLEPLYFSFTNKYEVK